MSNLTQTLKFFKVFCLRLVSFLRKYAINTRGATYGHAIEFMNPLGASNALSIHGQTQRLLKAKPKRNDKATTMQMQCKARKED
jgi:hypothetical protein